MAIQLQPQEKSIVRIVQAIIELVQGRQNSIGDVTLTVVPTSTVVSFVNCSSDCRVFLQPQNAAAVAAQATVAKADTLKGSFTIRHNVVGAGTILSFLCIGG